MLKPSTIHGPRAAILCLLMLAGCGSRDPFSYVQVSGKVTYEDGSLIPADPLVLTFYPQSAPLDEKTHPRIGTALVDKTTGTFSSATSHKADDGLVRGKHKVTLTSPADPLVPAIVSAEYTDPATTPLEVDTAVLPFELKVRKPSTMNTGGRP